MRQKLPILIYLFAPDSVRTNFTAFIAAIYIPAFAHFGIGFFSTQFLIYRYSIHGMLRASIKTQSAVFWMRPMPFHGLRHTHITLAIAAGFPLKNISSIAGHSTIGITCDTYAVPVTAVDREIADSFEKLLGGS